MEKKFEEYVKQAEWLLEHGYVTTLNIVELAKILEKKDLKKDESVKTSSYK